MKRSKRGTAQRKGLELLAASLLSLSLLGGCAAGSAAGSAGITLSGGEAAKAYFGPAKVAEVAGQVRSSLGLPAAAGAVPTVTYTRYLPGDCTRKGCPVGMYRGGKIFISSDLDVRYHTMVLAHELVHHYSRMYGLGLSEEQVIAQTREAGYKVPLFAMR